MGDQSKGFDLSNMIKEALQQSIEDDEPKLPGSFNRLMRVNSKIKIIDFEIASFIGDSGYIGTLMNIQRFVSIYELHIKQYLLGLLQKDKKRRVESIEVLKDTTSDTLRMLEGMKEFVKAVEEDHAKGDKKDEDEDDEC